MSSRTKWQQPHCHSGIKKDSERGAGRDFMRKHGNFEGLRTLALFVQKQIT